MGFSNWLEKHLRKKKWASGHLGCQPSPAWYLRTCSENGHGLADEAYSDSPRRAQMAGGQLAHRGKVNLCSSWGWTNLVVCVVDDLHILAPLWGNVRFVGGPWDLWNAIVFWCIWSSKETWDSRGSSEKQPRFGFEPTSSAHPFRACQ